MAAINDAELARLRAIESHAFHLLQFGVKDGASFSVDNDSPHLRQLNELIQQEAIDSSKEVEELKRLRAIEHHVWHMLDDSENRGDEIVIRVDDVDYRKLDELLPEDHPDQEPHPPHTHDRPSLADGSLES